MMMQLVSQCLIASPDTAMAAEGEELSFEFATQQPSSPSTLPLLSCWRGKEDAQRPQLGRTKRLCDQSPVVARLRSCRAAFCVSSALESPALAGSARRLDHPSPRSEQQSVLSSTVLYGTVIPSDWRLTTE